MSKIEQLKQEANDLGMPFRSDIKESTLAKRIKLFKLKPEKVIGIKYRFIGSGVRIFPNQRVRNGDIIELDNMPVGGDYEIVD